MFEKLFIKHVRFTFDEWNRSILKKKMYQGEDENLRMGLICIEKVKEPQSWNAFGTKITVADDGYKWLIVFPVDENYVITMYLNRQNKPVIWYIDICDGNGTDDDGVYFYNDMFLDLIVSTTKAVDELDRDEMEQAYSEGLITDNQMDRANKTAERLMNRIQSSPDWINDFCMSAFSKIQKRIIEGNVKIYE